MLRKVISKIPKAMLFLSLALIVITALAFLTEVLVDAVFYVVVERYPAIGYGVLVAVVILVAFTMAQKTPSADKPTIS